MNKGDAWDDSQKPQRLWIGNKVKNQRLFAVFFTGTGVSAGEKDHVANVESVQCRFCA